MTRAIERIPAHLLEGFTTTEVSQPEQEEIPQGGLEVSSQSPEPVAEEDMTPELYAQARLRAARAQGRTCLQGCGVKNPDNCDHFAFPPEVARLYAGLVRAQGN